MARAAERVAVAAETSRQKATEETERKEITAGSDLLDQLLDLNKICRAVLADAFKAGERALALQAVARLEKQFELRARLLGQMRDNQVSVVNLQVNPSEAERIARTFLESSPPDYVEVSLSERSRGPKS